MGGKERPAGRMFAAEVDYADPHNARMAAEVRDDLELHLGSTRRTLAQGPPAARTAAIAVIAMALTEAEDDMPRERLASLLAVAMVQLIERDAS